MALPAIDPDLLPTLEGASKPKRNLLSAGLSAGVDELQGLLGSAAEYTGRGLGVRPLEDYGARVADRNAIEAQQNGRADLEVSPWKEGGAPVLPWLGYQTAKQVPQLAAWLGGAALMPEAAVPAALSRLGAMAPKILGGGGLAAGAGFAGRRAALEAGQTFARRAVAGEALGIPLAVGSMYQEAKQASPNGVSGSDMAKVAAAAPFYAGLDALEVPLLSGLKNLTGGVVKKVVKGSLISAGEELVQEGVQTAMEQSFRTDLTPRDKLANIVEGAVTGAAVGGVFGGLASVRRAKVADPAMMSNDTLTNVVNDALGLLPAPTVSVDGGGRAAYGSGGVETLLATPAEPRETDGIVASYYPTGPDLIESQTIIQPKSGSLRHAKPLEAQEQRPMGGVPLDELQTAAQVAGNYLSSRPEGEFNARDQKILDHYELVIDELEHRGFVNDPVTNSSIGSPTVGAVERGSDVSGGSAANNSGAPASATPDIATTLKGISTRKAYAGATTLDEAKSILIARLEAGSSAKGDLLLAERLGVDLNEPAKVATAEAGIPGQTSDATSVATDFVKPDNKTPAPAAPANEGGGDQSVDADFQQRWSDRIRKGSEDTKPLRGRAVKELLSNPPANAEDAKRRIYDALAGSPSELDDAAGARDGYRGIEQLAREHGILDDQGQLTEEGVRIARVKLPLELTVSAAKDAGYTGAEASVFDRGARGDRNIKLGSITELKAFNDGRDWARNRNAKNSPIPLTATDDQTAAVVAKETARTDSIGRTTRKAVTSAGIPEKQRSMQFLNQAIDQVYGATLKPAQQAQLKQMVKKGATGPELDEAAKKMSGGATVLATPAPAAKPFRGTVIERGPLIRARERQRKAIEAEQSKLVERSKTGRQKAEATQLVEARRQQRQQIRDQLQRIVEEVEAEQAEARDVAERELRVDRDGRIKTSPARGDETARGNSEQAARFEALADQNGRVSPRAAMRHLRAEASNAFQRTLADKIDRAMSRLSRAGWKITINVVRPGDTAPAELVGNRGITGVAENGVIDVWLNSQAMGVGLDGTNYVTLTHELVHAVTSASIETGKRSDPKSELAQTTNSLLRVAARIREHLTSLDSSEVEQFHRYALEDEHELVAWALSDPRMQTYLESINYTPHQSFWARLVEAVREFLGLSPRDDNALSEVLRVSEELMISSPSFVEMNNLMREHGSENVVLGAPPHAMKTEQRFERTVKGVTKAADQLRDTGGIVGKLRQVTLGWMSQHGSTEFFKKWFDRADEDGNVKANGAAALERAHNEKTAIISRMAQMLTDVRDAYGALQSSNRNSAEKIVQLMTASEYGINPMKPWKEQSDKLKDSPNARNLERKTNEFHNIYRSLLGRGHASIYNDLRNVNDVLMLSTLGVSLHQQVDTDGYARGRMAAFSENPMDEFMREQASRDFSPADARKWWADKVTEQVNATFKFLDDQRTIRDHPDIDAKSKEALSEHIDDLGKRASDIQQTMRQMEEAPYFHLGRYGNFFVGWRVRSSEAMAKVAERLADFGFNGVISDGTDKLRVYMRVENRIQQKNLDTYVRAMIKEGLVEPETVRTGQRTKENFSGGFQPQWANAMIADIKEESDIPDDEKERIINSLRGHSVDLMPEMALARVMTKREGIPGYSPDMMRSFDWRGQVGINALAGMVTAPKITQAFVDMRGALDEAEKGEVEDFPLEQRRGMRDIIDEFSRREREFQQWPETRLLDQVKGIAAAWFLGASVSYGFVNLTQLGVTLWPELGARHGYADAFRAIKNATPIALKIMQEVAKHGKSVSLDRAMDAVITHDVLRKVVGTDMTEYLMRVVNTGNLDIGGPAREMVRSAEGRGDDGLDRVLRYASSVGYYTETASRLIAAIATRQLNPQLSVEEAAEHGAYVIVETMWNYSRTNQGRKFGKMGVFGAYTPLSLQFFQFQAQLTEKLFRETYDAIKGETAAERREARRYLAGHMAAMTALGGSLGLPMATVLAAAFDRLKDLWDDDEEPSNIRADYRNWLAQLLGKDAAEIVAHGGFRALGFDISSRIGEQDILPFSKFLADRRSVKDKLPDLALRTWGAPTSILNNFWQGGEAIMDGDVMGGMTKMLPNAFAAPAKAYKLTTQGYVDAQGKALPMDASTRDVMVQLLGFNPAPKAEYSEARQDTAMRKGQLTRQASAIRNQLADAVLNGDEAEAKELISWAQAFDQANPAFAVLPSIGETIRRRSKAAAQAQATRSPLGVSPKDLEAQQLTQYANF